MEFGSRYTRPWPARLFDLSGISRLRWLMHKGGTVGMLLLAKDVVNVAAFRGRSMSEYAAVDGSALLQIAYLGICLIYVLYYFGKSRPAGTFYLLTATPASILILYSGLCLLSSLWSPDMMFTLYRAVECLCFLLMIAAVCDKLSMNGTRQDLIEWLVWWSMWFLFWDTLYGARVFGIGGLLVPRYFFRRGAFAIGMMFFLAIFVARQKILSLITAVYTFLSLANTTYFGVFFGLIGSFWSGGKRFQIALFFLIGIMGLFLLGFGSSVIQNTLFYGKEGIGIEHTTGRGPMWAFCLHYGMQRFLYGYGFAAGETEALWQQQLSAISAHNVFLSAFLSIGIAGPILFGLFFVWLAGVVLRADLPENWRPAFLGTVIMVFMVSFASPGLGARVYASWIPAVLAAMGMCTVARWQEMGMANGLMDSERTRYDGDPAFGGAEWAGEGEAWV